MKMGVGTNADTGVEIHKTAGGEDDVGAESGNNETGKENCSTNLSRLHTSLSVSGLHDGLLEEIEDFISFHPQTNLIVIDTFEHIRSGGGAEKTLYSNDYKDMNRLREITNKHKLTLLLIHHTRKLPDADPLNTISGSTGLSGATDGLFILEKSKRTGHDAKLTIANRDTEGFCFNLRFDPDSCRWIFVGNNLGSDADDDEDVLAILVDDFLESLEGAAGEWSGTATELCNELRKQDATFEITPAVLTKRLKSSVGLFKGELGISINFERNSNRRQIILKRDNAITK